MVTARAQSVAEVQVTPETLTLTVGGRQRLFATAYDRQGNLIPNARFTFWSSDTNVAKVGREGGVTGVGPGLAKVEARIRGRQASTAILVTGSGAGDTAGEGAKRGTTVLTLLPAAATLLPGESLLLEARPVQEDGSLVAVGRVSWKTLHPEVAAVDSNGLVIAVAPGRTIVQATAAGGLMATAAMEVAAAEISLAQGRLVMGLGRPIRCECSSPGKGTASCAAGSSGRPATPAWCGLGPRAS